MIEITSPLAGWAMPLDLVPDPVFAQRILGGGIAVDPCEGEVRAPGPGTIVTLHDSRHAVTIALDSGPVVLIHVGLDTVGLKGEGFTAHCAVGDRVAGGDLLLSFDLALLARKARSLVTPVIVTNGEDFAVEWLADVGPVSSGMALIGLGGQVAAAAATALPEFGGGHSCELRLPLAHGLHARPAARLAELSGQFEAKVRIVTADGRSASTRSAVAMLALSLGHGTGLRLEATGRDAVQAVQALAELIESGMGEFLAFPEPVSTAPLAMEVPRKLKGLVAVAGTASGPACIVTQTHRELVRDASDPQREHAALQTALAQVSVVLTRQSAGEGPQAAIAGAHLALLGDPELAEQAAAQIAQGRSAGFAWQAAIELFAAPLRASPDPRFAQRVADLEDIAQSVQAALAGESLEPDLPPPGAILIGPDLLPSQLMHLAAAQPAGIALAEGGLGSHIAIIGAGLGLPMLCGLGPSLHAIPGGAELVIHGGALTVEPSEAERALAAAEASNEAALRAAAAVRAQDQAETRDGNRIEVFANLGNADDARRAKEEGAEGCGLLRTEFLFLDRASPPSREEQRAAYQAIADALGPRPLIVRTLDIGADKQVPWLAQSGEDNPALGLRGVRLQLAHRELLEDQLAALIATDVPGGLKVMLPMVSELAEIEAVREVLQELAEKAGRPVPDLGIMIETPAAALIAPVLAAQADFFSIGSNDLSQYVLARDRTAASVSGGLDGLHPAVLRLIAMTAQGAAEHGRWAGLCGSLAADPLAVPVLIGLGLSELSVPPSAVPLVKHQIRSLRIEDCRQLAQAALGAPDAATVRASVAAMLEQAR